MEASLWDQVGLPLLIGLATQIGGTALCSLSARLWKCFTKQLTPQTAVEESAHDQPLPEGDAAAHANAMMRDLEHDQPLLRSDAAAAAMRDLETGNGSGPAEGGESMALPDLDE